MDVRIHTLKKLILSDLKHHWTIEFMAEKVNLSSSHLIALFKNETGTTPIHYVSEMRLEKACELLTTTFLSVKEILGEIGIHDESNFIRNFKNKYGLTSLEYRRKYFKVPD